MFMAGVGYLPSLGGVLSRVPLGMDGALFDSQVVATCVRLFGRVAAGLPHGSESVKRRRFGPFNEAVERLYRLKLGHHFIKQAVGAGARQVQYHSFRLRITIRNSRHLCFNIE